MKELETTEINGFVFERFEDKEIRTKPYDIGERLLRQTEDGEIIYGKIIGFGGSMWRGNEHTIIKVEYPPDLAGQEERIYSGQNQTRVGAPLGKLY